MAKPTILYVSYDGMLEPLGQSQVMAYLDLLTDQYDYYLLSFEKPSDWADANRRREVSQRLKTSGIKWTPLVYHKTPTIPATLYDIAQGSLVGLALALRHRVQIVHARSYIPGVMALLIQRLTRAKFVFDMRGLWADERVDGGLWQRESLVHSFAKKVERILLREADHIVTLTQASAIEISTFPYLKEERIDISVIPTCANLSRFALSKASKAKVFTLGYVGSVGTWYLFDEVLECFKLIQARVPDARLLVVNRREHDFIRSRIAKLEIDPAACEITSADHSDVPSYIRRMTVGAAVIRPAYSKIASAPTKLAEYLGCGVPCLGNDRVGDMEAILEGERIGVVLRDFSEEDRGETIDRLFALLDDPTLASRCRAAAERLFSVEHGVALYRGIYSRLIS